MNSVPSLSGLSRSGRDLSGGWRHKLVFFKTGTASRTGRERTGGSNAEDEQGCRQVPGGLLKKVGRTLDATNLAGRLKSGRETRAFGILNEDDSAKKNGDDQDEDEENVAHGVLC